MSNKEKQSEELLNANSIDMESVWKAASSLLKEDTITKAFSDLKKHDFTNSNVDLESLLEKYSKEVTDKLDELSKQVADLSGELDELKKKKTFSFFNK